MSEKPNLIDVLEILMLKSKAARIYEEIDKRTAQLHGEFLPGRYDYDLANLDVDALDFREGFKIREFSNLKIESGQYLKFEIIDNTIQLLSGKPVFTSASIKPFTFSSRSLKRIPDSLKE